MAGEHERDEWARALLWIKRCRSAEYDESLVTRGYVRLRDDLAHEVATLQRHTEAIPIFIPPIAAILLATVDRPEAVGAAIISLREELAPLRQRIEAVERAMSDGDVPLARLLATAQHFDKALDKLVQPRPSLLSIARTSGLLDIAGSTAQGAFPQAAVGLTKTISAAATHIEDWVQRRSIAYLTRIRERFLGIRGYGQLIERVFRYHVSSTDYDSGVELLSLYVPRGNPEQRSDV